MALLDIRQLRFSWPGGQGRIHIDRLVLAEQERLFLHGPSGSGKSTLLSLIAGVQPAESGQIIIRDQDITRMRAARRDRWRADNIGLVFQQFNLLPYLSVLDNVLLPLRFSRARRERLRAPAEMEAERLLAALRLPASCRTQRADTLSIGQQQRVAVARALLGAPPLLIADEPTSALDADTREAFLSLLFQECASHGSAVIFVSHDLALGHAFDRALSLADINHAGDAT